MKILRLCAGATFAFASTLTIPAIAFAQAVAAQDQAKIEAGENVYNNYCQNCHGNNLVNTGQTFDLRRLTAGERARFENSVRNGKKQMPPWKDVLSADEIDQLWHYIRANANQK